MSTPKYWRMQLHPNKQALAFYYSVHSICAGFIGLDLGKDVGDLKRLAKDDLPSDKLDYWDFAHGMKVGDEVLVIAHHFPVAVVTIKGDYNYVREQVPRLGVWFRHFRQIEKPRFFADHTTNAKNWKPHTMTDTISPLHKPDTASYQLIEAMQEAENGVCGNPVS